MTVKEKPILFGDELVKAILQGRKTETRRPVRMPKDALAAPNIESMTGWPHYWSQRTRDWEPLTSPFGVPGDRLWVRECWQKILETEDPEGPSHVVYRADGGDYSDHTTIDGDPFRWSPSIHMPRWASRITLKITGVRVERVQDITEEGARREGVIEHDWTDIPKVQPWAEHPRFCTTPVAHPDQCLGTARMAFANAWNKIYGADAWDENGWVWTISFRLAELAGQPVEMAADELARDIIARQARGNVLLQSGHFETKEDIDARRDALAGHEF